MVTTPDPADSDRDEIRAMKDDSADDDLATSLGAILDFLPTSAALNFSHEVGESIGQTIYMRLKLGERDEVRTADERVISHMRWEISLYPAPLTNEHVKSLKGMGMMNYSPALANDEFDLPESCHCWAHIDRADFDILSGFVLGGGVPRGIRLHVKGIRYGWEPDGSAKVWDLSRYKNALITQMETSVSLATASIANESVVKTTAPDAKEQLLERLEAHLTRVQFSLNRMSILLGWTVLCLVAIALIALLK